VEKSTGPKAGNCAKEKELNSKSRLHPQAFWWGFPGKHNLENRQAGLKGFENKRQQGQRDIITVEKTKTK